MGNKRLMGGWRKAARRAGEKADPAGEKAATGTTAAPPADPARRAARRTKVRNVIGRVLMGVGLVALIAGNVAMALMGDTVESYLSSDTVDATPDQVEAVEERSRALARRVEGEGIVLLRNEDAALPLPASTTKVNVFGWASTQWVDSGSGSGQVSGECTSLLDALAAQGIQTNDELSSMYRNFQGDRPYKSAGALNSRATEFCRLYEPSIADADAYSDDLLANAKSFSDTAIVVISRVNGESVDAPQAQYKVTQRGGEVQVDVTRHYLELSTEEEALLRYVGRNFEHVVVVVNSTNAMSLGPVETTPGIDACLLVGTPGQVGANAVVDVLRGATNPSGRTTDTYAYDMRTAASWANAGAMGEGIYTNGAGLYPADGTTNANIGAPEPYKSVRFLDYVEGIYVGYRWYETADAEGFWDAVTNRYGQGYDGVVQYPFGYGLSYTTFSWEVIGRTPGDGVEVGRDSQVQVTVRVTNTGSVAGKDVVELYVRPPYTPGGIEKSARVLVDYAKTGLLEPGASEDVTLSFVMDDVASYDCYDADGNGFAGFELEAGSYEVDVMRDAHTLSEAAGAAATVLVPQTIDCETDLVTGAAVTNRFTGTSTTDGVSVDGSDSEANITYLTRADFAGTFPRKGDRDRAMTANVAALNLYDESQLELDATGYEDQVGVADLSSATSTTALTRDLLVRDGKLTTLGERLGANYDDEGWEDLLDGISLSDMNRLVLHGYLSTTAIDGIGKPRTKEVDGPAQIGSFNQLVVGVGYPNPTVLAQTWNVPLAQEVGRQIGIEAGYLGIDGWYAPCVNVHRTPLGGRNYEYYSEDPLVCGRTGGAVVEGSLDAGTYCYVKHFAVNNQDMYRDSIYTWLTEQTLREVYLRPFREVVEKNGCSGLMSSYNRIGAVWAGGSKALLTEVLRGEWDFEGTVITDYADHQRYMNSDQALRAGGDLYMDGVFRNGAFGYGFDHNSLEAARGTASEARAISFRTNLRRATKNVLYTWLNAKVRNVDYNVLARESEGEQIVRPVKSEGFPYVGTALALLDGLMAIKLAYDLNKWAKSRKHA